APQHAGTEYIQPVARHDSVLHELHVLDAEPDRPSALPPRQIARPLPDLHLTVECDPWPVRGADLQPLLGEPPRHELGPARRATLEIERRGGSAQLARHR